MLAARRWPGSARTSSWSTSCSRRLPRVTRSGRAATRGSSSWARAARIRPRWCCSSWSEPPAAPVSLRPDGSELAALKQRIVDAWSLGDYTKIAPVILPASEALVDACAVSAGQEVLDVAASEMFRVVRPGGTVGLAVWTPEGFQGRLFAIGNKYVPMAPGIPPSTLWGDEEVARERLSGPAASVSIERRSIRQAWGPGGGVFEFSR